MIQQHFSQIADKYRQLRTTDSELIKFVVTKVKKLKQIEAKDIG